MKTLIFNGSPRRNGDTVSLIHHLTTNLNGEYKIVNAYYDHISPCVDCRFCWKANGCAIDDEMQQVYAYLEECDNIIIASPIYFSELTGRLLDVASRLQMYYCAKHFRKESLLRKPKTGAVILVGGGDGGPEKAYDTARTILRLMNCSVIYEPVVSHHTNVCPAEKDSDVLDKIKKLLSFLDASFHKNG